MNLKRKTQLRNLLTAYRNDMCEEASELAEQRMTSKCMECDMASECLNGYECVFDNILLRLENELWEG